VSVFPRAIMKTFWEAVALPMITVGPMCYLPLGLINRIRHPLVTLAIGPFMFFRRDFYWRIGGHEAVKQDIAEDVFLARLVKRNGGRVALMDGTRTVSVRFYRGLLVNLAVFVAPLGFLLVGLRNGWLDQFWVGFPLLQLIIGLLIRALIGQRFGYEWWTVLLHPLTMIFGVLVALNSVRVAGDLRAGGRPPVAGGEEVAKRA